MNKFLGQSQIGNGFNLVRKTQGFLGYKDTETLFFFFLLSVFVAIQSRTYQTLPTTSYPVPNLPSRPLLWLKLAIPRYG